jgi:HSP20 family protein
MSLVKWNPFLTHWPSLFDDEDFTGLVSTASNNLDVYETDDEIVIKANVAGVDTQDIDITFEKGTVWIQAEKSQEDQDKSKKHYKKSSWRYSYRVSLPDVDDVKKDPTAEVKNGILTVVFAKSEKSKPRKVKVTAG